MADEYQCDHCKRMVDTIYFYRPLCEKCYREHKDKDKNECGNDDKEAFISGREIITKEAIRHSLQDKSARL